MFSFQNPESWQVVKIGFINRSNSSQNDSLGVYIIDVDFVGPIFYQLYLLRLDK